MRLRARVLCNTVSGPSAARAQPRLGLEENRGVRDCHAASRVTGAPSSSFTFAPSAIQNRRDPLTECRNSIPRREAGVYRDATVGADAENRAN